MLNQNNVAIEMAKGSSSDLHLNTVMKLLPSLNLPGKKVLDFGAGTGTLLNSLSSNGFSGLGIDALGRPVDLPKSVDWRVTNLNLNLSQEHHEQFDLVTAIEVIEHLENPRQVVRSLFSAVKPGGSLIISSPNVLSLRSIISLIFRDHFVDFLDSSYPAHITPVLPMDIERILREVGATHISLQYSGRGSLPMLTSLTWQLLSFNLLRGVRFSDHWFAVAQKP